MHTLYLSSEWTGNDPQQRAGRSAKASKLSRQEAAKQCVAVFDTAFFKALCEPARIAVLQEVVLLGRADVATIAERRPQDRSVITRHLQQLAAAGIVVAEKEGRHVFYQSRCRRDRQAPRKHSCHHAHAGGRDGIKRLRHVTFTGFYAVSSLR